MHRCSQPKSRLSADDIRKQAQSRRLTEGAQQIRAEIKVRLSADKKKGIEKVRTAIRETMPFSHMLTARPRRRRSKATI
jgi:hypothetical protein